MQTLYVLTYESAHRKTQDLALGLKMQGYSDVTFYSVPWIERKPHKPYFQHRPEVQYDHCPKMLAERLGYQYQHATCYEEIENRITGRPGIVLIGGAGILPKSFVTRLAVINSHPGLLPEVRGLDALKWAIWNENDIGVTTHLAGVEADTGKLIDKMKVRLELNDTLHSVAQRHYDLEIRMLLSAIPRYIHLFAEHLSKGRDWEELGTMAADYVEWHSVLTRRMPVAKEIHLAEMLRYRIMKDHR